MTFFVALFGCVTVLALAFAVFLRPFLPSTIGLWLGSEGFDVGVLGHPETQHELPGQWFVPVNLSCGFSGGDSGPRRRCAG